MLIYDLAQQVVRSESFVMDLDARNRSKKIHHASFDVEIDTSWKIPNS